MDKKEFLESVNKVSNFIVNYLENVKNEKVIPTVSPGYLEKITENECPEDGVDFDSIFAEFNEKILPGVTHWASPHFHAYFPAGNCFPSMTAELLIAGINNVGINWETSPAMAELETLVLNWLAKMMNLPEHFLSTSHSSGGGVLQNTSTECTLLSLLAARNRTVKKHKELRPTLAENQIASKLVIYSSVQSHSSVERIGKVVALPTRLLPCDTDGKVTPQTLSNAIQEDLTNGLIPCIMVCTMGATSTCSWDNLEEIGSVCNQYDIWLHVDAAYAGVALVCPELRYISHGIHHADSIAIALHKWFLMSFDVVAYWLKDTRHLSEAISVDRLYLKHKHSGNATDFVNMQLGNGRKFKSLKVWIVLKNYGVNGVQEHIRRHVMLAKYMENLMQKDDRFEVVTSGLGLVVFRLKSGDCQTEKLRTMINNERRLMMTPCHFRDKYVIRFVVNFSTKIEDVEFAWNIIKNTATRLEKKSIMSDDYVDGLIKNGIEKSKI